MPPMPTLAQAKVIPFPFLLLLPSCPPWCCTHLLLLCLPLQFAFHFLSLLICTSQSSSMSGCAFLNIPVLAPQMSQVLICWPTVCLLRLYNFCLS